MDEDNTVINNSTFILDPDLTLDEKSNLENLVKNYLSRIEESRRKVRELKETLEDNYKNDAVFQEHEEKVKEAVRVRNATKLQLAKSSALSEITERIQSMRTDLKEMEAVLNDYLAQYHTLTGVNQIEDNEGLIRDIVVNYRLVKRGA